MQTYEIKLIDGSLGQLIDAEKFKAFKSEEYNFFFQKTDGFFIRWGKGDPKQKIKRQPNKAELNLFRDWCAIWQIKPEMKEFKKFYHDIQTDGKMELGVPEILDLEISEICRGVKGVGPCRFCYKNNTGHQGQNMNLTTFKQLLTKLPATITQIAFGIGSIDTNPDLWAIAQHTREQGIIPNITINGEATSEEFDKLAAVMGAVAVSVYDNELTYNAIKALTDRNMTQVNIHYMISEETYEGALQLLKDRQNDPRLAKLNAIVFLSLKPKGRAIQNNYTKLAQNKFDNLFRYALENDIGVGFDSCSAQKAFNFIDRHPQYEELKQYIEPCESSVYSSYINTKGEYFPCSFAELENHNDLDWTQGIDVLAVNDFLTEVWYHERTRNFSQAIINCRTCGKSCALYEI